MRLIDLYSPLTWTFEYYETCVVYSIVTIGTQYVGSTVNLTSKLYAWRSELRGALSSVEVLLVCDKKMSNFYEEKFAVALGAERKKKGPVLGHVLREETKRKIAEGQRGKIKSPEAREKMRLAKLGKKQSQEHIAARVRGITGRAATPETKARISRALKEMYERRRVRCSSS